MTQVRNLRSQRTAPNPCPSPTDFDPRVSMVLAVLRGRALDDVARERSVDPALLERWLRDFLVAGSGAITNRPDPDEARQRDRFMAALAHDLRTPLAAARGWAALVRDGEVRGDQLTIAHQSVLDALTRLTDHVLDIELAASVSLGRVSVDAALVDVDALARQLDGCTGLRRGGHLAVHADPRLLARVLRDLWTTAHRDPAPERVDIDVVETGPWREIRVVRKGEQISPLVLKALFDPFGANEDTTGVTLGLYTARALVVAHGGFLGAEGEDRETVLLARIPHEPTRGS